MRECSDDNCKDDNGNCNTAGDDGLPVQCVGAWAKKKYFFLERYIDATHAARERFTSKGNSVFIDLYSGPGRCVIKSEGEEMDGGCLRVLNYKGIPFNEYYFMDISDNNIAALYKRTPGNGKCQFLIGDSNVLVHDLVERLLKQSYRYHFVYIDPFGPEALKFETIEALAQLKRIDLLIHIPSGPIRRNIKQWFGPEGGIIFDEFLGTRNWREDINKVKRNQILGFLLDTYKQQLLQAGFPEEGLAIGQVDRMQAVSIRNRNDAELYVLVLASKHELAQKIWGNIIKTMPDGQRSLF